ncbi:unnamed protein product [Linum trigynum]|uniref:Uncharacterized protein n=1 Tax=Linum trigynum TaxID=586398 RepID=A0AAV2D9W3_9ROSI
MPPNPSGRDATEDPQRGPARRSKRGSARRIERDTVKADRREDLERGTGYAHVEGSKRGPDQRAAESIVSLPEG